MIQSARRGGGEPLPPATRGLMEGRFGWDFSRVRIHDGPEPARAAAALSSRAFTVGSDIIFNRGQYAPGTSAGRFLLAHELAHVVQQQQGGDVPMIQRSPCATSTEDSPSTTFPPLAYASGHNSLADLRPLQSIGRSLRGQKGPVEVHGFSTAGEPDWLACSRAQSVRAFLTGQLGIPVALFEHTKVEAGGPRVIVATHAASAPGPTMGDVARIDQAVPLRGNPTDQPNYIDNCTRWIGSAPLGPDYILSKSPEGGSGISVPKADFHVDDEPLGGVVMAVNTVYRSRETAMEVVAELQRRQPDIVPYAFYLRSGLILPTVLSGKTLPNLIPYVRKKKDDDRASIGAVADTLHNLLWWYVGARFPIRVRAPAAAPPAVAAAAAPVFDAAKTAGQLFEQTASVANNGQKMLQAGGILSKMTGPTAAQKVEVMLEFFKRINFAIGKQGVEETADALVMYSEDSKYAFKFLKSTGEILYGRFDMTNLGYVWKAMP